MNSVRTFSIKISDVQTSLQKKMWRFYENTYSPLPLSDWLAQTWKSSCEQWPSAFCYDLCSFINTQIIISCHKKEKLLRCPISIHFGRFFIYPKSFTDFIFYFFRRGRKVFWWDQEGNFRKRWGCTKRKKKSKNTSNCQFIARRHKQGSPHSIQHKQEEKNLKVKPYDDLSRQKPLELRDAWTAVRCDCLPERLAHYCLTKWALQRYKMGESYLMLPVSTKTPNIFPFFPSQLQIIWH